MKLFSTVILGIISLNSIAQTTDTIAVYDHHCESLNPFEIDTTYFWYKSDTLYIRNIHIGFCSPTELKATVKTENDTIKIIVFRTGIDCLADCSFGYTIKLPLIQSDTLNIKIFDESFKVIRSELKTGLLIEEGKTWSIVNYPTENSNIYSYYLKIGPDTTSNSVAYKKLLISYDSLKINWSLLKLIRQEYNKVYYKDLDSEIEVLLYDFGVSESDSFQIYPGTKIIIDSIRSVVGKEHYYLSKGKATAIWIEGVGCTAGLLESHGGIGLVGLRTVLACCEINDNSLYHNENYSGCYISTSVDNYKNSDFFLEQNYPNPFKYYTVINVNLKVLPSDAFLNVLSIQGVLVKRIKLLNPGLNEIVIKNEDLPKGVYFYNLSMGEKFGHSMKLIHY